MSPSSGIRLGMTCRMAPVPAPHLPIGVHHFIPALLTPLITLHGQLTLGMIHDWNASERGPVA